MSRKKTYIYSSRSIVVIIVATLDEEGAPSIAVIIGILATVVILLFSILLYVVIRVRHKKITSPTAHNPWWKLPINNKHISIKVSQQVCTNTYCQINGVFNKYSPTSTTINTQLWCRVLDLVYIFIVIKNNMFLNVCLERVLPM